MENNEYKKGCIRNRTCYNFDDMIKLEHFDINKEMKNHRKIF